MNENIGKCPACYEYGEFVLNLGPTGSITFNITCKKCGWIGTIDDLVSDDEEKSIKRTKLIDDIIDE